MHLQSVLFGAGANDAQSPKSTAEGVYLGDGMCSDVTTAVTV